VFIDMHMKKANPVWQVILRLSIPEPKVEHHEGRGVRSCPIFPELRPILDEAFEIFGGKSEYVVAAPQYRASQPIRR
jgi:hypothetical protein